MPNTPEVPDFFFWLGADGQLEDLDKDAFDERQRAAKAAWKKWRDIDLGDESEDETRV